MKIPRRLTTEGAPRPPMTAMIDVVFLLLIYFICTARLTPPEAKLPSLSLQASAESAAAAGDDPRRLVVAIPPQPQPLVADAQVCASPAHFARLVSAEAQQDNPRPVVLDVDRQTDFGRAIDVYDACQLAGLRQVFFMVRVD